MPMGCNGPVIIDFPQMVSAAGNNASRDMLLRDAHNARDSLSRSAPELAGMHYGEEMRARYERSSLRAQTVLSGCFEFREHAADVAAVEASIEEARREQSIRQQGREAADDD